MRTWGPEIGPARYGRSVASAETGGGDVQQLAVLGHRAPGQVGDAGFSQFLLDLIVVERLGLVLFVDDLLELDADGFPTVGLPAVVFGAPAEELAALSDAASA